MKSNILKSFKKRPIEATIFVIIFLYNYLFFFGWIFVLMATIEGIMGKFSPQNLLLLILLFVITLLVDLFSLLIAMTIYVKVNRRWLFWIIYLLLVVLFTYITKPLLGGLSQL